MPKSHELAQMGKAAHTEAIFCQGLQPCKSVVLHWLLIRSSKTIEKYLKKKSKMTILHDLLYFPWQSQMYHQEFQFIFS